MKFIATIFLIGFSLCGVAQKSSTSTRSTDDNGKTLKLTLQVRNDSTSLDFERLFDVKGMDKNQKDNLINKIIDSLGVGRYFKTTTTSTTTTSSKTRSSEKDLVAAAAMDYIDAFYFGDTSKVIRSISPEVKKWGYSRKKDSTNYVGIAMSYPQMIDYVLRVKARNDGNRKLKDD